MAELENELNTKVTFTETDFISDKISNTISWKNGQSDLN
jgi:hypothetical protein